ncbi:MAG TPA: glycosyltransferase, partial [Candidatus Babeliaceae bacterium]|nr:glycosyltransferase [Candidatus Babeliaceae bacterium]
MKSILLCAFLLTFSCFSTQLLPPFYSYLNFQDKCTSFLLKEQLCFKNQISHPKKIIVFYSDGGGGHKSAWITLQNCLKDNYNIEGFKIFEEPLACLDPIKNLTFGYCSCEDFYNTILAGRWTNLVNQLYYFGAERIQSQKEEIETLLSDFLLQKKPDLVISVIPLLNGFLANVTKALELPFLVIPTDLDSTSFIYGLNPPYSSNFLYSIPFDDNLICDKLLPAEFPLTKTKVIGFPVRQTFFTPKNKQALKHEFHVPSDKPVVMILMGAAGSTSSYRYVRKIARMSNPMHLLVCLGRNERMRYKIEKIRLPEEISMSIIGFTPRIADLMSISDVLITKAGTVSVCEALHMHLPMILDNTTGSIIWEGLNLQFIEYYGFG